MSPLLRAPYIPAGEIIPLIAASSSARAARASDTIASRSAATCEFAGSGSNPSSAVGLCSPRAGDTPSRLFSGTLPRNVSRCMRAAFARSAMKRAFSTVSCLSLSMSSLPFNRALIKLSPGCGEPALVVEPPFAAASLTDAVVHTPGRAAVRAFDPLVCSQCATNDTGTSGAERKGRCAFLPELVERADHRTTARANTERAVAPCNA